MKPAVLTLFLVFSIVALTFAQNAADPQPKAAIAGTVVDAVSQQPLKAAEVTLRGMPANSLGPTAASTDAEGRFSFEGLTPGRYIVSASHEGYVTQRGPGSGFQRRLVSVVSGQRIDDFVVRLTPGAVISGHVTNEAGKAIRGVSMQAMRRSYRMGHLELYDAATVLTNDVGEYRLAGLAPGKYYLRADYPHHPAIKPSTDQAYVALYYPGTSDRSRAVPLVARAGEELSGMDMNIAPVHTVHVIGRAIDGATSLPAKGTQLTLSGDEGNATFSPVESLTGPKGTFEFRGIPPGTYVLAAQQPNQQKPLGGRTTVEVNDVNVDGVEVALAPGVEIRGHIHGDPNANIDFTSIAVELEPQDSSASFIGDIDDASVKADGSFVIRDVPEGTYRVNLFPVPFGFYLKSTGSADVLETGITIGRSQPAPLEITLSQGAAEIEGNVTTEDQPSSGTSVVLIPDGARRALPRYYKQSVTDRSGKFAMRSVAPGDYKLFAWDGVERESYMDPEFLQQYEDQGKAVRVDEAAHVNVQLNLISASN